MLLAPPNRHLIVHNNRLMLLDEPPLHSCKPAIDYLFRSIAKSAHAAHTVACLMTGMGRDGAAGLLELRKAGAHTIAQDEATCVIYGMPREAVRLGAAERILPLQDIGMALAGAWQKKEGKGGSP